MCLNDQVIATDVLNSHLNIHGQTAGCNESSNMIRELKIGPRKIDADCVRGKK